MTTNEEIKTYFNSYVLSLNVYQLEASAILVVMGDMVEPLYTTYMDLSIRKERSQNVIDLLIEDLWKITDSGENKFVSMTVPVEPSFYGLTDISYNRDLLLRSLRNSKLFTDYYEPKNIPTQSNLLAVVTDNMGELVDDLLTFIEYKIDYTRSKEDQSDELDHNNNPLTDTNMVYYDKLKMEDNREYYLYFKRRPALLKYPTCNSFSITFKNPAGDTVFTVSVNTIIDITSISISYAHGVDIDANPFSITEFSSYMHDSKSKIDNLIKGVSIDTPQDKIYAEYIESHVRNIQTAFEEYGEELCNAVGADYGSVYNNIDKHDESKYSPEEFAAYRDYFYTAPEDTRSNSELKDEFYKAWLHHIHNSKHHPEYWVMPDYDRDTSAVKLRIQNMPPEYIVEMICDWQSFAYTENSTGNAVDYFYSEGIYEDKKELMTKNTYDLVVKGLEVIKKYSK